MSILKGGHDIADIKRDDVKNVSVSFGEVYIQSSEEATPENVEEIPLFGSGYNGKCHVDYEACGYFNVGCNNNDNDITELHNTCSKDADIPSRLHEVNDTWLAG